MPRRGKGEQQKLFVRIISLHFICVYQESWPAFFCKCRARFNSPSLSLPLCFSLYFSSWMYVCIFICSKYAFVHRFTCQTFPGCGAVDWWPQPAFESPHFKRTCQGCACVLSVEQNHLNGASYSIWIWVNSNCLSADRQQLLYACLEFWATTASVWLRKGSVRWNSWPGSFWQFVLMCKHR